MFLDAIGYCTIMHKAGEDYIIYNINFRSVLNSTANMPVNNFLHHLLLILCCILLPGSFCYGQFTESNFIRYSVKDGLSDNYIKCLQQDEMGYIWIGTDMGLNRFDGHSFRHFYQGSSEIPLASSNIFQFKSFGPRKLGILSMGGFQLFNTHDFSVKNFFIPDSTAYSTYVNGVQDVAEQPGKKFILSTAAGIFILDNEGNLVVRHDGYTLAENENKRSTYGRNIFSLNDYEYLVYITGKQLIYVNTSNNSLKLVGKNDQRFRYFQHPSLPAANIWISSMQLSKSEFIFLNWYSDSIIYYDHAKNKRVMSPLPVHGTSVFTWESRMTKINDSTFAINDGQSGFYTFTVNSETGVINFSLTKHLPSYKIVCLFMDKSKRLWAGTSQGLLQQKLNSPLLKTITFTNNPKDTISGGISSIFRHKDKFYMGRFSRRYGLLITDTTFKSTRQVALFGHDNMWNEIRSIQMYHPDTLWLGTNTGIVWFDIKTENYGIVRDPVNPDALQNFSTLLAPARKDGYAWMIKVLEGVVARYHIPTRQFVFYSTKTNPRLPFTKIKSIAYDSYGDVWIGGHALARWNSRKKEFDTLIKVYGGTNKFNDDILTLSADGHGSLWLHNAYNDLLEYRIKEKRFISYTSREGLPKGEIRTFSHIYNDILWIGSHTTLSFFDTYSKKIKVYDHNDGLPDERPSSRSMYFDSITGYMYMPVNNSIVRFPQQYNPRHESGSDLIIQELTVTNKKSFFNPEDNLQLSYNENNLALYFTVIDFEERNSYQFGYMLNKKDGWTDLGSQRNINLTGLSPGNYEIQIKAMGKSGDTKLKTFVFSITPPFWKTTAFLILATMVALGLLLSLYFYRIRQIKQKANLDKLLAQTEMKALHAQMNPHFIFNSLNSIREMILNNETKEASHFLGKFAQLIRITLDHSRKTFISLHQTIDYLTRYIEMEQIRNELFTSRILADDELETKEIFLPPMLIQPFIENALWHGTKSDDKKINVNIDFKKEGEELICIIEDDGIGIEESFRNKIEMGSKHVSVGISNIENRIKLLNEKYNLKYTISIADKSKLPGQHTCGTVVILRLPIQSFTDE